MATNMDTLEEKVIIRKGYDPTFAELNEMADTIRFCAHYTLHGGEPISEHFEQYGRHLFHVLCRPLSQQNVNAESCLCSHWEK